MNHPKPLHPTVVSRRQFLSMLGVSTAALALPTTLDLAAQQADAAKSKKKPTNGKVTKKSQTAPNALPLVAGNEQNGARVLIIIELQGGNDGFSMLVPSGDARFRQLRDRAWLQPKDLQRIDDRYSMAKGIAPLAARLAFVEGVGVAKPDLSHSEMMTRWRQGEPDKPSSAGTGFLGRCCDALIDNGPIVGVSIGGGSTPALISNRATTVSIPDLGSLKELTADQDTRMRPTLSALTNGAGDTAGLDGVDPALLNTARAGLASGLSIVNSLGSIVGKKAGYPDEPLGRGLELARELVGINAGIRVIHIPWGSFDMHTGLQYSHPEQMRQLGVALTAFHNDLFKSGMSRRVMVATTSEFGRRPQANAGGTDHGTASTALMMGPVRAGRYGGQINFNQLDQAGNPAATVNMTDYYATLAQWLNIPASAVLGSGSPIGGIF